MAWQRSERRAARSLTKRVSLRTGGGYSDEMLSCSTLTYYILYVLYIRILPNTIALYTLVYPVYTYIPIEPSTRALLVVYLD